MIYLYYRKWRNIMNKKVKRFFKLLVFFIVIAIVIGVIYFFIIKNKEWKNAQGDIENNQELLPPVGNVVEEEFVDETEISIEDAGSYTVQIYSGNTVMTGEFEVE